MAHTKDKPCSITGAILPFCQEKYPNKIAIPSPFESSSLDVTIRCTSQWLNPM